MPIDDNPGGVITADITDIADTNEQMENMYLNFNVCDDLYGIEIRYVLQIVGMQEIKIMPEMPPDMKGFINLRGKVIPVLSMRSRFGRIEEDYTERTCIIVIQNGESEVGLIVDALRETITIAPENISPPPSIKDKLEDSFVMGIARLDNDETAVLINAQKLF